MSQDKSEPIQLSIDEVSKVAQLALLELDDAELEMFRGQLEAVLARAEDLQAVDVDGVPRTAHPYPLTNVLRPDVIELVDDGVRSEALAAAPAIEDEQYRVPPALGEQP